MTGDGCAGTTVTIVSRDHCKQGPKTGSWAIEWIELN